MADFKSVGVVKNGYLTKRARDSGRNWKKRYFVLNDNTFTYYTTHTSLSTPKGDLLLVDDTQILDEPDLEGHKFCIKLVTPFETMILSAESNDDKNAWKLALFKALDLVQHSLRGYMITKGVSLLEKAVRKFFVFHESTLYVHKDHEHTTSCLASVKITEGTSAKLIEKDNEIVLTDSNGSKINMVFEQRNIHEIMIWFEALNTKISKLKEEFKIKEIHDNITSARIKGILGVRPPNGGEAWKIMFVALVNRNIVLMTIDSNGTPLQVYETFPISENAIVKETSIRPNAFEIISNDRIIHLCTKTKEGLGDWLKNLKEIVIEKVVEEVITEKSTSKTSSGLKYDDSIIHMDALELISKDTFYEVNFNENRAIGIVLERAGDWAIAKVADFKETGVYPGSALTFINHETVIFDEYAQTIGKFKNWKPPLSLIFRAAPSKSGYLSKKLSAGSSMWKKQYFILEYGKLKMKNTEQEDEKILLELPLVGALVTFVSKDECGKKNSFKFISGANCLVLHARSSSEMRAWAATLYHAIAIANGGRHIIEFERQRVLNEEAREAALRAQIVEEETAFIVELLQNALLEESIEKIRLALEAAENAGFTGEFVDFAKEYLFKLQKAQSAIVIPTELIDNVEYSTVTNVSEEVQLHEEDDDVDAFEDSGGYVVTDVTHEIIEEVQEEIIEEEVKEEEGSRWGPPATPLDLATFFYVFAKESTEGPYLNVMMFSTIWRMVTGERGNLYKEMQMFNKFEVGKNGIMTEADFVNGWINLCLNLKSDEYLCRIKYLVGEDNIVF